MGDYKDRAMMRACAATTIDAASRLLDPVADASTLNYLRLAKEQLEVDGVYDEAEALGVNVGWCSLGTTKRVPVELVKKWIAEKRRGQCPKS